MTRILMVSLICLGSLQSFANANYAQSFDCKTEQGADLAATWVLFNRNGTYMRGLPMDRWSFSEGDQVELAALNGPLEIVEGKIQFEAVFQDYMVTLSDSAAAEKGFQRAACDPVGEAVERE